MFALKRVLRDVKRLMELQKAKSFQEEIMSDLTPPPTLEDPAVEQEKRFLRLRLMSVRGRQSTIATSPLGLGGLLFNERLQNLIKRKSLIGA